MTWVLIAWVHYALAGGLEVAVWDKPFQTQAECRQTDPRTLMQQDTRIYYAICVQGTPSDFTPTWKLLESSK